jgi:anaerobic ribonucleoside-triphosphate reductase activating protein
MEMNKIIRLASPLQPDSVVDGPGIRCVVWAQGCSHNCIGCHNPQTHAFDTGIQVEIKNVCNEIKNLKQNITLSGGDPFFQYNEFAEIAKYAKSIGLNVWAYTGFTFEYLVQHEQYHTLLENIDVLVDGKFDINKKSSECKFRGSTNQRLIDVKKSLVNKTVILWDDEFDTFQKRNNKYF